MSQVMTNYTTYNLAYYYADLGHLPRFSNEERQQLIASTAQTTRLDPQVRNRLIEGHLSLVTHIAIDRCPPSSYRSLPDILGEVALTLVNVADRYDFQVGKDFTSYIVACTGGNVVIHVSSTRGMYQMKLAKKIRLDVSPQDATTLEFMQGKCRGLYNWWVMKLRNGEKWPGWQHAKKTLQESKVYDPELRAVYGKLLHEVYFRLDGAMQAFFRRVKNGEKPGFPRVRPRHCFFTLCYPSMYIKIEGMSLTLPTGGKGRNKRFPEVMAKLTEEAPTDYGDVAISRDARGHYYASFITEVAEVIHEQEGILAIDLGIKMLATGVNEQGRFYHIGGFKGYRWYNKQLDKIRSKRDHCKKGSRRYRRLSQVYQRVSEQKRNKQRDSLHKASHLLTHKVVERTVVIGDLSQRQMVMNTHKERNRHLNRAVYNEWGLYTFVQMLTYKCVRYGKELVILDERDTSKTCSGCGHKQAMPLWKRTYRCPNEDCRLEMDRDENSAVNILKRYLARRGPHTGDPVRCAAVFTAIDNVNTCEHI